jgi:hypothetical protein
MYNKLAIFLCLSMLITGCNDFRPMVGAPWMQDMLKNGPEGGSAGFKLGWRHGCETAISATANRLQRSFYKFKQDYRMLEDPSYYTGWKASYNYCERYVAQYLRRNMI